MKFSPWLVTAFVSVNNKDGRTKHCTSTSFQSGRTAAVVLSPSSSSSTTLTTSTKTRTSIHLLPLGMEELQLQDNSMKITTTIATLQQHQQQSQYRSVTTTTTSSSSSSPTSNMKSGIVSWIQDNIGVSPAYAAEPATATTAPPPSKEEITLLRQAFAAFYGVDRNLEQAERLMSQAIDAWQRQPPDERAGLYRVRGDVYMALLRPNDAIADYSVSIELIEGPGGDLADPEELPASYLGRARAIRSLGVTKTSKAQAERGAKDYRMALRLSSREEWDTNEEMEEDGAMRNPYAAWEWGMALRLAGDYPEAARVHTMASDFFDAIGDRPHSVIAGLDAGIDTATVAASASSSSSAAMDKAKLVLTKAIDRTTTVEGRDIKLLQRVIAKEGEGRMALATLLWNDGKRSEAEAQRGEACVRLEQLEADAVARKARGGGDLTIPPERLKFNIDDATVGVFDISCARFKNSDFVTSRLEWPMPLQQKLDKLNSLGK